MHNFLTHVSGSASEETVEEMLTGGKFRLERIVSHGQASPEGFWYDQAQNEWVMVLTGRARLRFQSSGEVVEMGPGDYIDIPAHCRHRVDWTAPEENTVWLAIHYP